MLALRVTYLRRLSPSTLAYLKRYPDQHNDVVEEIVHDAERHAADYVTQWLQEGSPIPTVDVVDDESGDPSGDVHSLAPEWLTEWLTQEAESLGYYLQDPGDEPSEEELTKYRTLLDNMKTFLEENKGA